MKKILLGLLIFSTAVNALTADEIVDKMDANETSKTTSITMTQKVYQSSGNVVESKLKSFSRNEGDESIMEYIFPKRIMGMKILSLKDGEEIWLYSPRTTRVRKIAGSSRKNGVNGSDFSYDDMSSRDYKDDYTLKIIGEEVFDAAECYKLEALKKSDDVNYSKIVMLVDKEKFVAHKMEMYDEDGLLWKVLTMTHIQKVGNYYNADTITMENIQKGTKTEMITEEVTFDIDVDEKMFSQSYLKR